MQVQQTPGVATDPREYIQRQLTGARTWLDQAHGLLRQRPAIVPPMDHLARARDAAHSAAEHLYDIAQIDEPHEAVREALAAAEAIMLVADQLARPGIVDQREFAAVQLQAIDMTLRDLERTLGLERPPAQATVER